ncbi:hypothetical protein [Mesorhizobium sp. DCY119]|uniref:hypothetical protein n=1 Tax=Mesorhizobium sp. DCY119 TaxID=2108445 RepID=UPI000E6CF0C5|nr:hypothetical protein [Mesorhizobium sp. DCY119]RJG43728.1 hypothetical protein D3Y55_05275 [Mesorhizobium sp. DCY119]
MANASDITSAPEIDDITISQGNIIDIRDRLAASVRNRIDTATKIEALSFGPIRFDTSGMRLTLEAQLSALTA